MCVDQVYRPGSVLDIPKRPPWTYEMSKAEVEGQEEAMFKDYLQRIYSSHKTKDLSYFEHNLEVCTCTHDTTVYTRIKLMSCSLQ